MCSRNNPKGWSFVLGGSKGLRDDDQSIPCVLIEGKIVEQLSKIQLGLNLRPKEKKQHT
jgi:hypothetical protein